MAERTICRECKRTFKDKEGLEAHNRAKHPGKIRREELQKKAFNISKGQLIAFFILAGIVFLIWFAVSSIKTLPPTTMQGHIEENPLGHVLKEPMPLKIQKHMLEHSDGTGPPGIIVNYNCEDYECELGLIEKLETSVNIDPTRVYVAPFKGMDAKIALTRLNRIEVLEEYNEKKIKAFIEEI